MAAEHLQELADGDEQLGGRPWPARTLDHQFPLAAADAGNQTKEALGFDNLLPVTA